VERLDEDARIALTREGQILVLDGYDLEKIRRFIGRRQ